MEYVLNKYLLMDCFYACVSYCSSGLYVPPGGNMPAFMMLFVLSGIQYRPSYNN